MSERGIKLHSIWQTSLIDGHAPFPEHDTPLDDLYDVGPWKPIGNLPAATITDYCGATVEEVVDECEKRGLSTYIGTPNDVFPGHHAVCAYDERALQVLLDANSETLLMNNWPQDVQSFVIEVNEHDRLVDEERQSDLYTLIAWSFRSSRTRYARPFKGGILDQAPIVPKEFNRASPIEKLRRYISYKRYLKAT